MLVVHNSQIFFYEGQVNKTYGCTTQPPEALSVSYMTVTTVTSGQNNSPFSNSRATYASDRGRLLTWRSTAIAAIAQARKRAQFQGPRSPNLGPVAV